ncbi:MAG TPA: hypothetical protein VNC84_03645 [Gammaproteobacteria bacterium]|jgi:hypothetical protein|nr:hypothetical protein [Gammaproteobacteria bacterium]
MNEKKVILAMALSFLLTPSFADVNVNGYYKENGTYVEPHQRSNPDGNPYNNWSTEGNTNPHTGKEGTRNPDYNSF